MEAENVGVCHIKAVFRSELKDTPHLLNKAKTQKHQYSDIKDRWSWGLFVKCSVEKATAV